MTTGHHRHLLLFNSNVLNKIVLWDQPMKCLLHVSSWLLLVAWCGLVHVKVVYGGTGLGLSIPDTDTTTTYSSILPQKYSINLAYIVDGRDVTEPPCDNYSPGASCLVTLQANRDSVKIMYRVKPEYKVNITSTIRIQMCYGADNTSDRPWRQFNDVISQNKQCNLDLIDQLPPQGDYTYQISENIGSSVYSIEVIDVLRDGTYAAFGNSSYFQVNQIDDTPPWLLGTAGGLAALGPLILIGFVLYERQKIPAIKLAQS